MSSQVQHLFPTFLSHLQWCIAVASKKGATTWLTTLALSFHRFTCTLHKGAFWDALCLWYGWIPSRLPSCCDCGALFTVKHFLCYSTGGFPAIRHKELRDTTVHLHLLTEVCNNVMMETPSQEISGDQCLMLQQTSRIGHELIVPLEVSRIRIKEPFLTSEYLIYLPGGNPFAQLYTYNSMSSCHKMSRTEKRRAYDQRIHEVECGSFSSLIFSTAGVMAHNLSGYEHNICVCGICFIWYVQWKGQLGCMMLELLIPLVNQQPIDMLKNYWHVIHKSCIEVMQWCNKWLHNTFDHHFEWQQAR